MTRMPMSGQLIIHKTKYTYIQHAIYNGSCALMIRIPTSSQLIINQEVYVFNTLSTMISMHS